VNIPQSLVDPTDMEPYVAKSSEPELQNQTKELLCYLWDNYLEVTRASISLMGVGDAYLGIKQLLISRGKKHLKR
jgi:histone deacetylase 6